MKPIDTPPRLRAADPVRPARVLVHHGPWPCFDAPDPLDEATAS